MTSFRAAGVEEDDELSRILCNAFLPLWNHNWFHSTTSPLEPVPTLPSPSPLLGPQASRVKFYLSVIKLTRLIGGSVSVATIPSTSTSTSTHPDHLKPLTAAILLWLPPHHRLAGLPSALPTLWKSGFLSLLLPWHYGLTGLYRIDFVFEANVHAMFDETLPHLSPTGYTESECAFVQMLASTPAYLGKGYGSALLSWQMERHFEANPAAPVILDASTQQGVRAYERLGFRVLARRKVETGADARGTKLKEDADRATREAGEKTCVQSVLVKLP